MIAHRAGSALIVSVALFAGCGGDDDDSKAPTAPVSVPMDQVPAQYADALCDAVSSCFGDLASSVIPGDCTSRLTKQIEQGELGDLSAAIAAGTASYDGTKVPACVAAVRAASCDALERRPPAACREAVVGKVQAGEACTRGLECGGDAYCKVAAMCPGTCTAREAAGAACASDNDCQDGLACNNAICQAHAAAGQPCGGMLPQCSSGLYCAGFDAKAMTPGSCRSFKEVFSSPVGQSCDLSTGALCASGSYCAFDSVEGMMAKFLCVGPSSSGGACALAIPESCPQGEFCDVDLAMGKFKSTCKALPGEGEPCRPANAVGSRCGTSLVCDGAACRAQVGLGADCSTGLTCESGSCVGAKCVRSGACTGK
jgi:hypothetical protein